MNDEKRLLLAIVLSVVVILGWNVVFMKPVQQQGTRQGTPSTDQAADTTGIRSSDTEKKESDKIEDKPES